MTLRQHVIGFRRSDATFFKVNRALMIKLRCPETTGFDYPMTLRYTPEKLNPHCLLAYLQVLRPLQAQTMADEMKIRQKRYISLPEQELLRQCEARNL